MLILIGTKSHMTNSIASIMDHIVLYDVSLAALKNRSLSLPEQIVGFFDTRASLHCIALGPFGADRLISDG